MGEREEQLLREYLRLHEEHEEAAEEASKAQERSRSIETRLVNARNALRPLAPAQGMIKFLTEGGLVVTVWRSGDHDAGALIERPHRVILRRNSP